MNCEKYSGYTLYLTHYMSNKYFRNITVYIIEIHYYKSYISEEITSNY